MYQIAYIGRWETLPETAAAICDYDTSKLEVLLQGGLDLDVPIQLSEYIKLMPLEIEVFRPISACVSYHIDRFKSIFETRESTVVPGICALMGATRLASGIKAN